jgi:hypothetical protein
MSSKENPYDFGPGESASGGQSNLGFEVGKVDGMQCLQEGWALIQDKYWLFLGVTFVGLLIGGAIPIILQGAMICGIYLCLFKRMRGEEVSFDDLFKGFDYFKDSLIAMLLMMCIGMALAFVMLIGYGVIIAASFAGGEQVGPFVFVLGFGVLFIVYIALALAVQAATMFVFPLIVDRGLAPMDALKTSWAAGKANLGGLIMFFFMSFVLSLLGALACGIGVFFVLPILFAGNAVVYRRVFPGQAPMKAAV